MEIEMESAVRKAKVAVYIRRCIETYSSVLLHSKSRLQRRHVIGLQNQHHLRGARIRRLAERSLKCEVYSILDRDQSVWTSKGYESEKSHPSGSSKDFRPHIVLWDVVVRIANLIVLQRRANIAPSTLSQSCLRLCHRLRQQSRPRI